MTIAPIKPDHFQDMRHSVPVPRHGSPWRKMLAFTGPGYMVAVGYMDPGNWATDIAGGSAYGYRLLCVVLISSVLAMLFQALSARLGIATGSDLAQACRQYYPRPVSFVLWVLCEIAIVACDVAEIIGTAIALKLLFGLPLLIGIALTVLDTLLVLLLQRRGFRALEAAIMALMLIVALCFAVELFMAKPDAGDLMRGFVPDPGIFKDSTMLLLAAGILGATVMPHNLYLHSSIVQSRAYGSDTPSQREAIRFATADVMIALLLAFFVNAAILIMGASVFHTRGIEDIASIEHAHELLAPLLGTAVAGVLFAVALLASGQNSTVTATLAGQIVLEGFLQIRLKPWVRRLVTRLAALIPSFTVCAVYGEQATGSLLIWSQVVLSLQLPFAILPLVHFATSRRMGPHRPAVAIRAASYIGAAFIVLLNGVLAVGFFF